MNVPYQIIKSDRKTIAIQIKPDGQVVVRCPKRMRIEEARRFVESRADWIEKHLAKRQPQEVEKYTSKEIEQLRRQARKLVTKRVRYSAPHHWCYLWSDCHRDTAHMLRWLQQ